MIKNKKKKSKVNVQDVNTSATTTSDYTITTTTTDLSSGDYTISIDPGSYTTISTDGTSGIPWGSGGAGGGYSATISGAWSSSWPPVFETEIYPKLPNSLGVIYIEDDEIKCRTVEGEDIILGKMKEGDEKITINIIATIAKKLLQRESVEA